MDYTTTPMVVVGNTGAGKSTAVSAILGDLLRNPADDVVVLYYDAKHMHNIVNEYYSVAELYARLNERLSFRENIFSGKSFDEYTCLHPEEYVPRIVVVIDNYDVAYDSMSNLDETHFIQMVKKLVEKRAELGTNLILTTNSVKCLPVDLDSFPNKIVLRTSDQVLENIDTSALKEPGECLLICGEDSRKTNLRDL